MAPDPTIITLRLDRIEVNEIGLFDLDLDGISGLRLGGDGILRQTELKIRKLA